MRMLLAVMMLMAAPGWGLAQGVEAFMCQTKPTVECVLDAAIVTARAAEAETKENPPYGRIIETAAKNNLVDLALGLTARLDSNDTLAIAPLAEAAARAGRLAETDAFFMASGIARSSYAFAFAPALVETGREGELAAFMRDVDPLVAEQLPVWRVAGHLFAGRTEEAKILIEETAAEKRVDLVLSASEYVIYDDRRAALGRHLLPYVPADDPTLVLRKANIAEAVKDRDLALKLRDDLPRLPAEDRSYAANAVIRALAASGEWQEALDLVDLIEPDQQPFMLAIIAGRSGQFSVFGMVEKKLNEAEGFRRDGITRVLIRALVLAGYAPVAQRYIDLAESSYERDIRIGIAASARAEIGQRSEAVRHALSIRSTHQRAWALWEVADKFRE